MVNALVFPGIAEDTVFLCLQTEQHRKPHTHRQIAQPNILEFIRISIWELIKIALRHMCGIDMIHCKRRLDGVIEISPTGIKLSFLAIIHIIRGIRIYITETYIQES